MGEVSLLARTTAEQSSNERPTSWALCFVFVQPRENQHVRCLVPTADPYSPLTPAAPHHKPHSPWVMLLPAYAYSQRRTCASPERGHFYPLSSHRSGLFCVALGTAQVTQAIYGTQHPSPILDQFSSFVFSRQMTRAIVIQ